MEAVECITKRISTHLPQLNQTSHDVFKHLLNNHCNFLVSLLRFQSKANLVKSILNVFRYCIEDNDKSVKELIVKFDWNNKNLTQLLTRRNIKVIVNYLENLN